MKTTYNTVFGLLALITAMVPTETFAQGCPACSNPALQSSEKLEAGIDTLFKGSFRTTLNITNGFNYSGGHLNTGGMSSDGQEMIVPLHEHVVDLDFIRSEVSLEYTFKTNWSAWLRVPYDVKMQSASVNFIEPVTQVEQEAIIRKRDLHHRNETYSGMSDLRLLVAHRFNGFLSKKARLDVAFGTSVPVGAIEVDPLAAGESRIKHLHIQFGTGTFDPLLELHYVISLSNMFSMALFTMNKLPLYSNKKMYQGPTESTNGVSFGYSLKKWVSLRATFANFSQAQAEWNGVKDPNSGLISVNGTIMPTFKLKGGLTIAPGYRFPIYQRTISEGGDTFTYGPTFVLNVSVLLRKG